MRNLLHSFFVIQDLQSWICIELIPLYRWYFFIQNMWFAYKVSPLHKFHFITFAISGWVDIFSRSYYADIIIASLEHCRQEKWLHIHAWCLMTNHIHLIVSTQGEESISDIFRDMKKYTSKRIRESMNSLELNESRREWMSRLFEEFGSIWQEWLHPVVLESANFTKQKLDYIHMNPVVAGYVWEPWEWRYSSAKDYMKNLPWLLRVEKIEL